MDPLRLVVRVIFAYLFALALMRVSGKRAVKQGDAPSFVLALILGDMFDDLFWAEISASQFVVATGTLVLMHVTASVTLFRAGQRRWRQAAARGARA
jgi:uncharacterized membrane protein YcaP (DUF421 family)